MSQEELQLRAEECHRDGDRDEPSVLGRAEEHLRHEIAKQNQRRGQQEIDRGHPQKHERAKPPALVGIGDLGVELDERGDQPQLEEQMK